VKQRKTGGTTLKLAKKTTLKLVKNNAKTGEKQR